MKLRLGVIALIAIVAVMAMTGMQLLQTQLVLVDRTGSKEIIGKLPPNTSAMRVSPDGRQVVFDTNDGREGVVWIYDLTGNRSVRRLTTSGDNHYPIWSGDGQRVLFNSDRDGEPALYWKRANGTGPVERLNAPGAGAPESWSVAHQMFSFITGKGADLDIWTYSLADKKTAALIEESGSQHSSAFSPDGRWITYMSDQSGRDEVYVQPFPSMDQPVRISREGGSRPMWSHDGSELFFDNGNSLFAVPVRTDPAFFAGEPVRLPIEGFVQGSRWRQYDLMPDGKHFIMMFPLDQPAS